jgi:hypothetical protein
MTGVENNTRAPSLSAYVVYNTVQLYSTTLKLLRVQYLHYKQVLNHFCRGGGGRWHWESYELLYSVLHSFHPVTYKY